ncbi:MAG TPA: chloride channel protein [Gemmataceae bacterium]|nr:chloride channel protein [Gemmataceae bacterium]
MTDRAASSVPLNPLHWFPEFWQLGRRRLKPQARLLGLSLGVGIIAGLGAVLFYLATRLVFHYVLETTVGYHPGGPANEPPLEVLMPPTTEPFHWWMLLIIPAVGGLVSGFLVYTFAPEAEGHGTDSAIASYHFKGGAIRPRVPLVKILASAVTLGTGGSGGREGPIAQIGAGFASWIGGLLRLRPAERRLLMAAGMGAGIAAIFRAPLAGALFAAEVLYRSPDFESEVVIPAALACITAYCTFGLVFSSWSGIGWDSLFYLPKEIAETMTFDNPLHLIPYLLLALFMVVLAMLYTRSFYGITELFHRLPIRPHFKPAIGAFLAAVVALILYFGFRSVAEPTRVLAVLSYGYGILQKSLTELPTGASDLSVAVLLLAVAAGKILTTGLTIGSGGSGGVFGPSMVIGGCGGGALGILLNNVFPPGYVPPPASFIIVGMAGFFAAAAKTPLSTLVMVSELTGNYNLLLPTLWVCTLAFLLSDEQSIYSSQVQSRSRSPAHQGAYVREVLTGLRVGAFITPLRDVPYLHPGDRIAEVIEHLNSSPFQSVPVVDPDGRLLGVVTVEEVLLASQSPHLRALLVAMDLMRAVEPLSPDDPLDEAMEQFVESNLLALPVVDNADGKRVLGIVKRADLSGTYLRQIHGTQPPTMAPKVEPVQES